MNNQSQLYFKLYDKLLKQPPQKADVLVWLQGDRLDRGVKILELYNDKLVDLILISGNNQLIGPTIKPGEDNITLGEMRQWLLDNKVPAEWILIDDKSFNTKEQSVNILKLAQVQGWQKIIIVGSSYYQPRAWLTFVKTAQELNYQGKIISQAVLLDSGTVPGGRIETAGQLLEMESAKTETYQAKGDLATYEEAEDYLINTTI